MSANLELMSMYIEKDLHDEVRLKGVPCVNRRFF